MADAFKVTGRAELLRDLEQLPADLLAQQRTIARRSAQNIQGDARRRLRQRQKTSAHELADHIEVHEDAANSMVSTISFPPGNQPANVTIWNEHGTSTMDARPYMRPAADAERENYARQNESMLTRLLQRIFGREAA